MVSIFDYSQVFTVIIFYMIVYNLALSLFFITINQISNVNMTTTFSFYNIPQGTILSKNVLISFFSMAGVPPFVGFFSKLSIFVIITNSFLYLLFPIFFILLFSGLYFYIQNVRLILTPNSRLTLSSFYNYDIVVRLPHSLASLSYVLSFILIFGVFFIEEFFLYSTWLLA